MATKKYHYIGVQTDNGMRFVTKIDYSTKSANWNKNEKPLCFSSKSTAEDIVWGLCMNFSVAVVVTSLFPLDNHIFEKDYNKDQSQSKDDTPWEE